MPLQETSKRLGATPCNFDVSKELGCFTTLTLIEEQEGGLHILVNNAAIEGSGKAQNDLENATLIPGASQWQVGTPAAVKREA